MATLYGAIWDPQDDYHRIPDDAGRETAPIEEQYHFVSEYTNFDVDDRFRRQNILLTDSTCHQKLKIVINITDPKERLKIF